MVQKGGTVNNKPNFDMNNSCRRVARKIYLKHNEFIPIGFEIHHLDGNPNNNNPSNLKAMSIAMHKKIHCRKGQGKGRKASEAVKNKIKKGLLDYYSKNPVWNKGIPSMTDYNKRRLKETHWKNHTPQEVGAKISKSKMGHSVSIETREKIRKTLLGKKLSPEHKQNISKGNFRRWKNAKNSL